ncbi:DUF397 domain-containing protein [Actinomadura gamaensis]|uniref:DUF397 domain-containing protein n=1 Tax=Actinomadura gamaensis TaxID=1763541 RepID=A0ABV9U384_9ACTN
MRWRKSTYSGGADDEQCVELASFARGGVSLRDSKAPSAGLLHLTAAEFGALVE